MLLAGERPGHDRERRPLRQGVRDFFDSDVWLVVRNVALFFAVAFWLASAYWVYKDARRRIEDPWLIAVAVALGIFPPFFGPLIYMFFRPPEYLDDVRGAGARDPGDGGGGRPRRALSGLPRPASKRASCLPDLHDTPQAVLPALPQPLEPLWQICPYCETPVEQPRAASNL